jgi:hypothetical protein
VTHGPQRLYVPPGPGWSVSRLRLRGLRDRGGRFALLAAWKGDPHAAVVARPAQGLRVTG